VQEERVNDLERVARTIAGLYNNARGPGVFGLFDTKKMSSGEAVSLARKAMASSNGIYFDYHNARVMKVRVRADGSGEDGDLYDRDNGHGAYRRAIEQGLADAAYDFTGIT
jgi:hypothetical protein